MQLYDIFDRTVHSLLEVEDGGKETGGPVVLKDIWIDHDRMREDDILAQLYNDMDGEDKRLAKKHFLTPICHEDVLVAPDTADDTRDIMRRLKTTEHGVFELPRKDLMVPKREDPSGSQGLRAEKGVTIDLVPGVRDVMRAPAHIITVKLGFFSGNTECPWQGTIHFISVEVSAQGFLVVPQSAPSETLDLEGLRRQREIQETIQKNGPALFVHIHLHGELAAPADLKTIQHQLDQAMILFPSVMESTRRRDAFQSHFPSICEALAGGLQNKSSIYTDLDFLQEVLVGHYTSVEATLPHSINPSASKDQIYLKQELLAMLKRPRPETASDIGVAARKRR
ncbi:hypothetical protein BS47DRAFT_1401937 [Hydnum rufescens UP504]|uniref:Uncharacterized protein n=1 Tax=Hydnum rufescens UP504 TaxID=1448309 RepID=A0A9P6ADU3_9AGAM|nr:hypothetical protein BS47DRAFT_1401937 [Hydnum rufescens UP504]